MFQRQSGGTHCFEGFGSGRHEGVEGEEKQGGGEVEEYSNGESGNNLHAEGSMAEYQCCPGQVEKDEVQARAPGAKDRHDEEGEEGNRCEGAHRAGYSGVGRGEGGGKGVVERLGIGRWWAADRAG